jgi:hypothetical protein
MLKCLTIDMGVVKFNWFLLSLSREEDNAAIRGLSTKHPPHHDSPKKKWGRKFQTQKLDTEASNPRSSLTPKAFVSYTPLLYPRNSANIKKKRSSSHFFFSWTCWGDKLAHRVRNFCVTFLRKLFLFVCCVELKMLWEMFFFFFLSTSGKWFFGRSSTREGHFFCGRKKK